MSASMKLKFLRDTSYENPDAHYKGGLWYDNVCPVHVEMALREGVAEKVYREQCGCLVAGDGSTVRQATVAGGLPCQTHGD